tara:strand:+ start:419 stop:616 length:198 start_codon:yes stop_codon:yes gene_type:complete
MSFTYSVNTDGTVSNVQFDRTEYTDVNITCAEVVAVDLELEQFLDSEDRATCREIRACSYPEELL